MGSSETNSDMDFPLVYSIHSQKGGVGKTSVALAIGGLTAVLHKRKTILIDADLTGSSLADVPIWGHESREWKYFNDLILAPPHEFGSYTSISPIHRQNRSFNGLHSFYREVPNCPGFWIMASSPRFWDIARIIPLISQEDVLHFFRHRIEDILARLFKEDFDVVIIDNPPGLFGVSLASLRMVLDQILSRNRRQKEEADHKPTRLDYLHKAKSKAALPPCAEAVLITTQDPGDYRSLFPYLSTILDAVMKTERMVEVIKELNAGISVLLNKAHQSNTGRFDPAFEYDRILKELHFPQEDGREVHGNVLDYLMRRAGSVGVTACRNIPDFDLARILSTVQALETKAFLSSDFDIGGMEGWCRNIAKNFGLLHHKGALSLGSDMDS